MSWTTRFKPAKIKPKEKLGVTRKRLRAQKPERIKFLGPRRTVKMAWVIKSEEKSDKEYNQEQLKMGIEVEMEHEPTVRWLLEKLNGTYSDELMREVAKSITKDHLNEGPKFNDEYYTLLKEGEKKMESES
jgi:hypothetical protein